MTSFRELGIFNDMPKGWAKGKGQPKWHEKVYTMWKDIWRRCRCDTHSSYKYYKDCDIWEGFRHLSNFVDWIENEPRFKEFCITCSRISWTIDKDLKDNGYKYYPDCMSLITKSENSMERNKRKGTIHPKKPCIGINKKSLILLKSLTQGELLGFNHTHIANCCKGVYKSHKKYKWYFINYKHNQTYRLKR